MNIYAVAPFVSSLLFIALGLFVFLNNPKSFVNATFALTCFTTFIWQFSWFVLFNYGSESLAKSMVLVGYTGIIFIPLTFYHFYIVFLGRSSERIFIKLVYAIGFIFLSLNWFSPLFIKGYYRYSWGYYPKAGLFHPSYLVLLFVLAGRVFILLNKELTVSRKSSPLQYNQTKYALLAMIIYTFASLDFATNYGLNVYPLGFIFILISLGIIAYAMAKYRLMDINVALTRAGIFAVVYFPVAFLPFWIAPKLIHTSFWWMPTLLMGILATLGIFIYNFLRRRAEDVILKDQRRYQMALIELSKTMGRIRDIDKLLRTIVLAIVDNVKVPFAAVYLKDEGYKSYHRKHYFPKKEELRFQECIPLDSPLVNQLIARKKPLLSDEIDPQDAIKLDSGLAIPCFIEDSLLGFLILGHKPNGHMYSPDDLLIFEILSYSTSLAIENSQFWKEIEDRQRQARIQEMDIFAYSVAHEIQNPMHIILNQIRFLKDYLLKYITNEEDLKAAEDSCYFISEASQRTSGMVEAVQAAGKKVEGGPEPLNIADVVESFLKLYQPIFKDKGVFFTKELPENIPLILGYMPLLMHLFINLANNSIHALMYAPEKKINLKVELLNFDWIRIVFSDTGYGITEDLLPIIFNAFTTTKASTEGTGMGLHIAKTIVTRHKGKIWAESEGKDKGATFFIELPVDKETDPGKPKGFDKSKRLF
jgi:signal transduction histidine kinase